jgi:hypothetical protein
MNPGSGGSSEGIVETQNSLAKDFTLSSMNIRGSLLRGLHFRLCLRPFRCPWNRWCVGHELAAEACRFD